MKAVRIHEHGGPEVLRWEDVAQPEPGRGEVVVCIKAAAMNHLDLWVRQGFPGIPLPMILGSDGAGVVQATGKDVQDFSPGDEVVVQPLTYCGECRFCDQGRENYCDKWGIVGENGDGTQCEFMVLEAKYLRPKPANLTFEEAAAFSLTSQTAYAMLVRRANIQAGETVLVWGAGSGVGSMAIQIAKVKGCRVIAMAGSEDKIELGKSLGADLVLNYRVSDVASAVKKFTEGQGVDVVFEHVGRATWDISLKVLGKGGRLVTCGATTGPNVSIDIRYLFHKQHSIYGSTMGDVAAYEDCYRLVTEGSIRPVIDRSFPMSEIRAAHEYLENSEQAGKVILLPD